MAVIEITISNKKLASIQLVGPVWTQLYVNDKLVPGNSYKQTKPGTLTFKAYATGDLVPSESPVVILAVKNKDSNDTSTGILNFSAIPLNNDSTMCTGLIATEKGYTRNALQGPLRFSLGRITGVFSYE
jgi:hypothetical protein